ncbi:flagellar hook-length control protein FliK [Mesorhizobium sp. J428]|uniref:flagellar hook-length control protein FliK n=1 Tax=Mesorhizobium sp. J428 TaxID=2898440 RepID=UPI002151DF71|nr:flagellar hook-length control protein FliK [Mesorhizobium sp. J428]MCR5855867.1 flagellar hook-length control protein FliK [Mesorhizobium sp. J428]
MTSLVSASKLAIAETRQQARKDGSKGHSGFQDAFRASGAERHGSTAAHAPAPSSPSPMQGLAQRLDAFEKIAGLVAERPAEAGGEVPQPAVERANARIAEAGTQSSPAPARGQAQRPETFEKVAGLANEMPAQVVGEVPQPTVARANAQITEAGTQSSPAPARGQAQRLDAFEKIAGFVPEIPAEAGGEVPLPVVERANARITEAVTQSSPEPAQGPTQQLDTFEKIASLVAERPAEAGGEVPQPAVERANAQITEAPAQSSPAPARGQAQRLDTFEKIADLTDDTPAGDAAEVPQRTVERTKAPIAQAAVPLSPFDEAAPATNVRAGDGNAIAGDAMPKLAQTIAEDAGAQVEQVADPDVTFDADPPLTNDRIGRTKMDDTAKADARLTPPSTDEKGKPAPRADMRPAPVEVDTEAAEVSDTTDKLEPASEPEIPDTAAVKTDAMPKQPEAAATWLPLHDASAAAPTQKPNDDRPAETVAKAASDTKAIPASNAPREPAASMVTEAAVHDVAAPDDATASDAPHSAPAVTGPASVKPAAHATATDAQARKSPPAADVATGPTSKPAQAMASGDNRIDRQDVSRPAPGSASDQAKVSMNAAAQAQPAPRGTGGDSDDRRTPERAASARATSTATTPAPTATTPAPASRPAQAADATAVHPGSPSAPANERVQSVEEPAEKEPVRSEAGDDAKPAVSGDARPADAARPAPAAVTAVSMQTQPAAPAAPAAAVIATVRADASWAAYFRDTQPGAGAPVNSLKIQLNPLELGNVTAHLRVKDDAVSVELTAETADAQRQLATDADTIAKSLRALGIDVDRVTVQLSARADAQPQADASSQPRQQGFAADSGAGSAREQDGGSRREQQRHSGEPAPPSGQSAASSNRSASARYI